MSDEEFVKPLPCIVCGVELESIYGPDDRQPSGAVMFEAGGNYGSEVWDMDPGDMMINVCDKCLVTNASRVEICYTERPPATYRYEPWNPEVDQ